MTAKVFEIPLNAGQNEGIDRALLPDGVLRLLQNARLTRDGRIEPRPAYTALPASTWVTGSSNIDAIDLTSYEDELVVLGTLNGLGLSYPTQPFRYVGETQAAWRGIFDSTTLNFSALPFVSDLEILWQAPSGLIMSNSDVAYANGFLAVCMVNRGDSVGKLYLFTDAGVLLATQSISAVSSIRVVAAGTTLVAVSRMDDGTINARTFDTTSALAYGFGSDTALVLAAAGATGLFTWDVAPLAGSTDFLVAYPRLGAAIRVERRTAALALVNTTSIAVVPGNMAVCGHVTNQIGFTYLDATGDVKLYTINPATMAVSVGPTNVLGSTAGTLDGVGTPAICFNQASRFLVQIQCGTSLPPEHSQYTIRTVAAHTNIAGAQFDNTRICSKLYVQDKDSAQDMAQGIGTLVAAGNILDTDQLYSTSIGSVADGYICAGRWNYNYADMLFDATSTNRHGRASVATDGAGTFFATCGVLSEKQLTTSQAGTLQLVKFRSGSGARRQTAEMQGALYVAGGFTGYYDGANLVESGFLDTPVIYSNVQGGGSLTLLTAYSYVAMYEWRDAKGRIHRSAPSTPFAVTMTGGNQGNTLSVSSARSLRRVDTVGAGTVVNTVIYRTTANDSVMYRVAEGFATAGSGAYADAISIADTLSDVSAQSREVLYTQSQKPLYNVSPYPCRFIAAGRDRLIFGGLPDPYLVSFSQLPFPNEPLEGADIEFEFAYQQRLPEKVTGVAGFGDTYIAFTASGIYEIPGEGPQRNGTGEFFYPRALYSDGGCIDWRSIVDTAAGLFFQMAADKIYRLSPGGGVDFVGEPIRDTLALYPVIRGACLCTETQRVVFSVVDSDSAPTTGGLLIYDIVHDAWSFDNVGVTTAPTEYDGRLAFIQSSVVNVEAAAVGSGGTALPEVSVRTGSIRLFSALGYGTLCKVGLLMTYLGDCTVEGFISYDDGKTWTSMGSEIVTAAALGLASGDPHTTIWTPARREVDRFALRFDVTNVSSNTGGVRMHVMSLEAESQDFTTRKPARDQR